MNKKKDLAAQLRERADTIEFRRIKAEFMKAAQNNRFEYRILYLEEKTIIRLQNSGINVERAKQFSYEVWLLTW